MSAPETAVMHLDPNTCRRELEALFARDRRELLACFRASGQAHEVRVDVRHHEAQVPFRVVPTSSELDLRLQLPDYVPAREATDGTVFLAPWLPHGELLPFDLQGRFAKNRAIEVGAEQRLAARLGVRGTTPAVNASALGRAVLGNRIAPFPSGNLLRPDLPQLLDRYLEMRMGFPQPGSSTPADLLRWALSDTDDDLLAKPADNDPVAAELQADLIRELANHLEKLHSGVGPLALRARLLARGSRLWVALVLVEAYLEGPTPNTHAEESLRAQLEDEVSEIDGVVSWLANMQSEDRQHLLDDLLRDDADSGEAGTILSLAESRSQELGTKLSVLRERFERSPRLKIGLKAHLARFDQATAGFLDDPSSTSWAALRDCWKALRSHRLASSLGSDHRDLVRLAAWLIERGASPASRCAEAGKASLDRLVTDYVQEGGWVDLARRRVRGRLDGMPAGQRLLASVDEVRDALDTRFADRLIDVIAADKWKSKPFVPIHRALAETAGRLLSPATEVRKLLVLVLDGASHADLAELLETLEEQTAGSQWGPLQWRAPVAPNLPAGLMPPVIAELPTVTEVSRASLLEGKARKPGQTVGTGQDPSRFRKNAAWRKALGDAEEPTLLLEPDAIAKGGGLSPAMTKLVQSKAPLVGLVYNVIDKQLSGSAEQRTSADLNSLRSLREILDEAEAADRAILLLSDHGHVRTDRLAHLKADGILSGRHRELQDEEKPRQGEVALPAKACWRPKGTQGVAVLVGEKQRYSHGNESGLHGGLSLAEGLAPAALLGPRHLEQATSDPELRRAPIPSPAWWDLDRPIAAQAPNPEPVQAVPGGFKFEFADEKPTDVGVLQPAAASEKQHPTLARLQGSEIYEDRRTGFEAESVATAESILDTLLRVQGHRVGFDTIARRLNTPSFQVQGLLFRASEFFNAGEMALQVDPVAKEAVLDTDLLIECFELDD